jgi:hypothetical protein
LSGEELNADLLALRRAASLSLREQSRLLSTEVEDFLKAVRAA